MRWDWLNDTTNDMQREQKNMRRLRRRQLAQEAEAILAEEAEMGGVEDTEAGNDDQWVGREDNMDVDSSDDSEDADSSDDSNSESAASEVSEDYWGDHISARNAFIYNHDSEESDSEGSNLEDDANGMVGRRRSAMIRARRSLLQMLRR